MAAPNNRNTAARRPASASKGRRPSRPRQKSQSSLLSFFKDKRTHFALGIILVAVAFVMAISAVSHLKNGAADESLFQNGTGFVQVADSGEKVANAAGSFGAWLSHALMTEGLGVGAFVLVYWLGALGLSLLGVIRCKFWSLTFKCLLTAVAVSIIVGYITIPSSSFIHWGGVHGRYVNLWLIHVGNWPLALAVNIALAGILIAIFLKPLKFIVKSAINLIPKRATHEDAADTLPSLENIGERSEETPAAATTDSEVVFTDETEQPNGFATSALTERLFAIDDEEEPSTALETIGETDRHVPESVLATSAPVAPVKSEQADSTDGPTFIIKETPAANAPTVDPADIQSEKDPTKADLYDPRAELSRFVAPSVDLLKDRPSGPVINAEEQQKNKDLIVKTLLDYKIPIQRIEATIGPTVTLYEIVPAEGVRIAQIQRLENDIALSLAALGIRIIAPIPGAGTVGIEVPNRDPKTVSIRSVIGSEKFAEACRKMRLPMALGATISNDIFIQDLAKMPHLLVAGATGQGKSVGLNCIIASLIYAKHPSELKFVFIDPKMVEFAAYRKLERHYLAKLPDEEEPIITDAAKVPGTLSSLCIEMDERYKLMSKANARTVEDYNEKFCRHSLNPENGHRYMPYIVTIVDEFADLISVGGKDVPNYIARIAAKGRASGMHIIIATQRPSADVISGIIKNNFPGRIAFRVMSMVDSKTILDRPGANQLIGRGDMLFLTNGAITRVQCAFIDTPEIDAITDHIDAQIGYESAYLLPEPQVEGAVSAEVGDPSKRDALFADCARFIVTQSTASTSSLQRRFSIGYNKAGKIMDQMEAAGIVGPAQGAKPRAVLMDALTLETIL